MKQAGFVVPKFGIETLGLKNLGIVHWNSRCRALRGGDPPRRGAVADGGALVVRTGQHTGRSPNDKFVVEAVEQGRIDWGKVNQPIAPERFARSAPHAGLRPGPRAVRPRRCAGADPAHRLRVRVVTEIAWHNLFARNMFIAADGPTSCAGFSPTSPSSTCRASRPIPKLDGTDVGLRHRGQLRRAASC